jgi:two-component system response regulator QseB
MRILLVEDDAPLGEALSAGLRGCDYAVDWVQSGDSADTALRLTQYDAVLLDQGLPDTDGLRWLARWRAQSLQIPVLILTARDALPQRVAGLDAGADDYLVKPVQLEELAARLRAALRRASGRAQAIWRHGALVFDPAARRVDWRGAPLELTAREISILEVLLQNPGRILSKGQLAEKLFGWDAAESVGNALEVHIHHFRRKIAPAVVRTVRGVGYALGTEQELS